MWSKDLHVQMSAFSKLSGVHIVCAALHPPAMGSTWFGCIAVWVDLLRHSFAALYDSMFVCLTFPLCVGSEEMMLNTEYVSAFSERAP
jgi:hypothetical protein